MVSDAAEGLFGVWVVGKLAMALLFVDQSGLIFEFGDFGVVSIDVKRDSSEEIVVVFGEAQEGSKVLIVSVREIKALGDSNDGLVVGGNVVGELVRCELFFVDDFNAIGDLGESGDLFADVVKLGMC